MAAALYTGAEQFSAAVEPVADMIFRRTSLP